MEQLLFGAAYYDEYMPYDRLKEDIRMMKAAGINVVRIAESTWSTCEPQPGKFDFSHVVRVLDAMEEANISVIIGTPTYAIPAWMAKMHPEIMVTTRQGKSIYGARQSMDITNKTYLFYAERVIRELMQCAAGRNCVIGFQIDNETKAYGTAGDTVQRGFVKYLREKFKDDLSALNYEFGLDYWSNRVDAWEDFPDVNGTINASLLAEFHKYQGVLVTEFLNWQANIVREYARRDQFITQNFDFEWRGYSFGVQPSVNQYQAAECLTLASGDIYHPSQDKLTGKEIAFCGDILRSLKNNNYLIMETQAQGYPCWTPYRGQLRQQAFSHLAAGAGGVMYWHWHSIHNAVETYWKGLLSHDFEENDTYLEAKTIGADFKTFGSRLICKKKKNKIAMLLSNEALTALECFKIDASTSSMGSVTYNDIVRYVYDALYEMNIECDVIWPETKDLSPYQLIIVPALYAASKELLLRLKDFVRGGGNLFMTFKSAFANEHVRVSHESQPHLLTKVFGMSYNQFAFPSQVGIASDVYQVKGEEAELFMELLKPETAEVLAYYQHDSYQGYGAVTRNQYGGGTATWLGCKVSVPLLKQILQDTIVSGGIETEEAFVFPIVVKKGWNGENHILRYYFNYSGEEHKVVYSHPAGIEIIHNEKIEKNQTLTLAPWGFLAIEEQEL